MIVTTSDLVAFFLTFITLNLLSLEKKESGGKNFLLCPNINKGTLVTKIPSHKTHFNGQKFFQLLFCSYF